VSASFLVNARSLHQRRHWLCPRRINQKLSTVRFQLRSHTCGIDPEIDWVMAVDRSTIGQFWADLIDSIDRLVSLNIAEIYRSTRLWHKSIDSINRLDRFRGLWHGVIDADFVYLSVVVVGFIVVNFWLSIQYLIMWMYRLGYGIILSFISATSITPKYVRFGTR
jgi:hypothetical protein